MLYVVGGRARPNAAKLPAEHLFERGVILRVDPERGRAETVLEYASPPCHCPDYEPSILFKASTLKGNTLYACTTTEVLLLSYPNFTLQKVISLPFFNDVHHVTVSPQGTLFVAVSGLDMVVEITEDGDLCREWSTTGDDTWRRFSRSVDYRKIASTKPHQSHPNYVFFLNGEAWVTRFQQRDAICLTRPDAHVRIGGERPHDGIVWGRRVFFTTVDGHLVIGDCDNLQATKRYNIGALTGKRRLLGWCRGLCVLNEDEVVVGFSRIRQTKSWENLAWAVDQIGPLGRLAQRVRIAGHSAHSLTVMPTRLYCISMKRSELLWELNLEAYGINAIFSILHDGDAGQARPANTPLGTRGWAGHSGAPDQRAGLVLQR